MSDDDTVGSLLANIATSLNDALRIFTLADKRQWGPDEYDQFRALQDALDEAKKDFQEMGPLVNGQFYYENDRRPVSLDELRALRSRFDLHAEIFKDWVRTGGPINPLWIRETSHLRRELHHAQRRAARRIFNTGQESSARCLGAFLVYRRQRQDERERAEAGHNQDELPRWRQQQDEEVGAGWHGHQQRQHQYQSYQLEPRGNSARRQSGGGGVEGLSRKGSLERLVPACNATGKFQRFGDADVAFVCDFCDGFLVWHDVRNMPAARTPLAPGDAQPNWQAAAESQSGDAGDHRTIVFAPLAIANHLPPRRGEWLARTCCPYCDQYTYVDAAEDGGGERRYAPDEDGFSSLQALQEHLEWNHTSLPVPSFPSSASSCSVM